MTEPQIPEWLRRQTGMAAPLAPMEPDPQALLEEEEGEQIPAWLRKQHGVPLSQAQETAELGPRAEMSLSVQPPPVAPPPEVQQMPAEPMPVEVVDPLVAEQERSAELQELDRRARLSAGLEPTTVPPVEQGLQALQKAGFGANVGPGMALSLFDFRDPKQREDLVRAGRRSLQGVKYSPAGTVGALGEAVRMPVMTGTAQFAFAPHELMEIEAEMGAQASDNPLANAMQRWAVEHGPSPEERAAVAPVIEGAVWERAVESPLTTLLRTGLDLSGSLVPIAVVAAATRNPGAVMSTAFMLEGGNKFYEEMDLHGDPELAGRSALIYAAGSAALESLPVLRAMDAFKVSKAGGANAIRGMAEGMVEEGITETLQSIESDLVTYMIWGQHNGVELKDLLTKENMLAWLEEGVMGSLGGGVYRAPAVFAEGREVSVVLPPVEEPPSPTPAPVQPAPPGPAFTEENIEQALQMEQLRREVVAREMAMLEEQPVGREKRGEEVVEAEARAMRGLPARAPRELEVQEEVPIPEGVAAEQARRKEAGRRRVYGFEQLPEEPTLPPLEPAPEPVPKPEPSVAAPVDEQPVPTPTGVAEEPVAAAVEPRPFERVAPEEFGVDPELYERADPRQREAIDFYADQMRDLSLSEEQRRDAKAKLQRTMRPLAHERAADQARGRERPRPTAREQPFDDLVRDHGTPEDVQQWEQIKKSRPTRFTDEHIDLLNRVRERAGLPLKERAEFGRIRDVAEPTVLDEQAELPTRDPKEPPPKPVGPPMNTEPESTEARAQREEERRKAVEEQQRVARGGFIEIGKGRKKEPRVGAAQNWFEKSYDILRYLFTAAQESAFLGPEAGLEAAQARRREKEAIAGEADRAIRITERFQKLHAAELKKTEMTEEDFDDYLGGGLDGQNDLAAVSPALRSTILDMRRHAKKLADFLIEHPNALPKSVRDTIFADSDLFPGRSHLVFQDSKKWKKHVLTKEKSRYDNAVAYLQREHGMSEKDAKAKAMAMLQAEPEALGLIPGYVGGKAGQNAVKFINNRAIPSEIDALLGLDTNAGRRYIDSVTRLAKAVHGARGTDAMAKLFLDRGIASTEQTDQFASLADDMPGGKVSHMGALGQLYVTQETKEVLQSMYSQSTQWVNPVTKFMMAALDGSLRAARLAKTAYSISTVAVNISSWGPILLATGRFKQAVAALPQAMKLSTPSQGILWFGATKARVDSEFRDIDGQPVALDTNQQDAGVLRELGIAGESVTAQWLMAKDDTRLRRAMQSPIFERQLTKYLSRFFEGMGTLATDFYAWADDVGHAIVFLGEMQDLAKIRDVDIFEKGKRKSLQQLMIEQPKLMRDAASITRRITPTYSRAGKLAAIARRVPIANFIIFDMAATQSVYHLIRQAHTEMKSDNVKERKLGRARMGSAMFVLALMPELAKRIFRHWTDTDEEDEENLKGIGPEYYQDAELIISQVEKGTIRYFDFSRMFPYSNVRDPMLHLITGLLKGEGEAAFEAAEMKLQPYLDEDFTYAALVDVARNKKPTGGRVYVPKSVTANRDIAEYLARKLGPGTVLYIERQLAALDLIEKEYKTDVPAWQVVLEIVGVRIHENKPAEQMGYVGNRIVSRRRDATQIFADLGKDKEAAEAANAMIETDILEAHRKTKQAIGLLVTSGYTEGQAKNMVRQALAEKRVGEVTNFIMAGKMFYPLYTAEK